MKTQGSKSALNKKPKPPAKGGTPVTIESGTTVVLPDPTDAPPPPKTKMRRSSKEPKTAFPAEPTAPAEVPDWARRAAARDTATDMATVPEVAPTPEITPAPPTAKKGRAPKPVKAKAAKASDRAATPGSLRAIGNAWIESIRTAGHSVSTVSSYGNDLEVAYEFLDGNTAAAELTEKQIAKFNASDLVLKKKNGKAKAQPTILKTRRALRLALVWAEQKGMIKKAPIAAKTPA